MNNRNELLDKLLETFLNKEKRLKLINSRKSNGISKKKFLEKFEEVYEYGITSSKRLECFANHDEIIEDIEQIYSGATQSSNESSYTPSTNESSYTPSSEAIEYYDKNGFITDKDGNITQTSDNFNCACELLGIKIALNEITKNVIISVVPNSPVKHKFKSISEESQLTSIRDALINLYSFKLEEKRIKIYAYKLAEECSYNPIRDWLEDNYRKYGNCTGAIERVANLIKTPSDYPDDLKQEYFKRNFINAINIYHNSLKDVTNLTSQQFILTLQGKQGTYKTTFITRLFPNELRNYVMTGVSINPSDRDNKWSHLSNAWIEIGEADVTTKRNQGELKQFITETKDSFRKPYQPSMSIYARTTFYMASVNPEEFLHDVTGNRRWGVISVESIDINGLTDELVCQLWAEAYHLARVEKEPDYLSTEYQIKQNNQNINYSSCDKVEAQIENVFDWEQPKEDWNFMSNALLNQLFNSKSSYQHANILSNRGCRKSKINNIRGWYVPRLKEESVDSNILLDEKFQKFLNKE